MSFYSDFIERSEAEFETFTDLKRRALTDSGVARYVQKESGGDVEAWAKSFKYFADLAKSMRRAKIVRFSGQQAKLFLSTPRSSGQDYARWLRLPYPLVWLNLDEPFTWLSTDYKKETVGPFSQYRPYASDGQPVKVRGILLEDQTVHNAFCEGTLIDPTDTHRIKEELFFQNEPANVDVLYNRGSVIFKDCTEESRPRAMWGVEQIFDNIDQYAAERDPLPLADHYQPNHYRGKR